MQFFGNREPALREEYLARALRCPAQQARVPCAEGREVLSGTSTELSMNLSSSWQCWAPQPACWTPQGLRNLTLL